MFRSRPRTDSATPSGRNAIRSASGTISPVASPRGEAYFRRIITRQAIERATEARRQARFGSGPQY